MFISPNREKLIHALIYFLRETKHAHTLKLFKLLNFSDFEHYRQTGRTITGLEYRALPMGPVPTELFDEIKRGGDADLKSAIALFELKDDVTKELQRRIFKPRVAFDSDLFSKRELKILSRVAEFFKDSKANDMSEFSHMRGLPWTKVFMKGKGQGRLIPIGLALESEPIVHDAPTIAREELEDRQELLREIS